ncbi:MAG: DNA-directed RNA polymerase subunit beta, partial [Chloroflexota bacterium]|nr:DNA-directed RNA polymerase subunit beta [Chloroflexota bacterium]
MIQTQLHSFDWFLKEGLKQLFEEISPIRDFTGSRFELHFLDYKFRNPKDVECLACGAWSDTPQTKMCRMCPDNVKPKHSEHECREGDLTYSAPLYVRVQLLIKETGEIKEQDIFMGDLPLMTPNGIFMINGVERVVVSQLIRSPGVYFTLEEDVSSGRRLCYAKLIPERGTRLEFETSNKDVLSVKVDGKRKIPATTILRAVGYGEDEQILKLFKAVDTSPRHQYVQATMDRDAAIKSEKDALIEFYKRLRPGDPLTVENARGLINNLLFNPRRYNLGKVGRYKLNKRLGLDVTETESVLTREDLVEIIRHIIRVNNGEDSPDDIDHLG